MADARDRLKVLIVAPHLNGAGLGEVYSIFRWVEALADRTDLTVLTLNRDDRLVAQLPSARVVVLREPGFLAHTGRLNATLKPWLPVFFKKARRWIRSETARGTTWDIVHSILPQAMRYAIPFHGLDVPYVLGPLGGSLDTPAAFRAEVSEGGTFARLRGLDRLRLRRDPWLRRGYEGASLVMGVAPYVEDTLRRAGVGIARFEPVLERAHESQFPDVSRDSGAGEAHLLHVGRVIRTKGLRDVIRAMALLKDRPRITLTSAGDGPDLAACRAEATALGVADRVTFLGRVPRQKVDELYAAADIFCFPSFREPMGGVFFEAMEYALPIIAAARGGPDFILNDRCAIRLPVETPDQFSADIAQAIRQLADAPDMRRTMGAASVKRLKEIGGWGEKADRLVALYREIIAAR